LDVLDSKKLKWLDESSVNLAYTRLYGWAKSSKRINEGIKDVRFERQSILSAIGLDGVKAPFVFAGTLNKEIFSDYLRFQLAPTLKNDDILILDNCSVHKSKLVLETIEELGINVVFLPPYSPDFNPIELVWAFVKDILRKLKARTYDTLISAIDTALSSVTNDLISGWAKHCGYSL